VAPLSSRALRIRAESRLLRAQARAVRHAARDTHHAHRLVSRDVAEQLERRNRSMSALGTWPYWAPATPELLSVLVVARRAFA
jgi:hypothetical protein